MLTSRSHMRGIELLCRNLHYFRNSLGGKCSVSLLNFFNTHAFCQARQDEGNRESSAANSQLATQKPRVRNDPFVVLESQRFLILHDITQVCNGSKSPQSRGYLMSVP